MAYEGQPDRRLLHRTAGGARLHYFAGHGLLRFEGRAAAIVADDNANHNLAHPADMVHVAGQVRKLVEEMVGERIDEAEAARLDIACDVRCTRDDGLALLRVMRHVRPPNAKLNVYENPHDLNPETVNFVTRGRGRILLRSYDKGLESGGAGRGEWIRVERQVRLDRARRRRVENVDGAYLATNWSSHLRMLSESARAATVGNATTLTQELAERVREGTLTPARARSLLGAAYLLPELERDLEDRTARRWRSDLGKEGILPVRDEAKADLTRVPLPALLRELASRFDALDAVS